MGGRCGKYTGDVAGDVYAAERQLRGILQMPVGIDRHAGGAAAHVEHGHTELAFVAIQHCLGRRHRGRHQLANFEVATREAGIQGAQSGGRGIDHMHPPGQAVAEQAARIIQPFAVVGGEIERQ